MEHNLSHRFEALAEEWRKAVAPYSSSLQIAEHPAYQEIINMGPDALPHILNSLEKKTEHWFWALREISGFDPVPEEDRGRVEVMRTAWLEWGRTQGYLPKSNEK